MGDKEKLEEAEVESSASPSDAPDTDADQVSGDKAQSGALETILDRGVPFDVSVKRIGLLRKCGILPKKKTFNMNRLCLGAIIEIESELQSMPDFDVDNNGNIVSEGIKNIGKIKPVLVNVITLAMYNTKATWRYRLFRWRLKRFLDNNLTSKEMLSLMVLVVNQMDIEPFLMSGAFLVAMKNPRAQQIGGKQ